MTEAPNIYTLLSNVMTEVQTVRKTGRNEDQNYSFRGVDAVVNAVGPVLRKHKVLLLPELLDASYRDVQTSRGKPAREVTVRVKYTFIGPAGDKIEVTVPGESMDNGDKGTAKAMSVAYRIALLQALCIPTDEPDPDEGSYERSNHQPPPDPVLLAKNNVKTAWEKHRGTFEADVTAVHFQEWSQGELLKNATAERLNEYAGWLLANPTDPEPGGEGA
jgi:hypothetical protein